MLDGNRDIIITSIDNELLNIYPITVMNFICGCNHLTTLVNSPRKILEEFNCSHNRLTNLEGGPEFVERRYDCTHNNLKSLSGAPKRALNFWCCNNPYLKDVSDLWETDIVNIFFQLTKRMAILPLVKFKAEHCIYPPTITLNKLLAKNRGTSKQNIINFQYDLIENGFSEYARWRP